MATLTEANASIQLTLRRTVFDSDPSPDHYQVIWSTPHHGERPRRPHPAQRWQR
jgi:hypothetical protein